LALPVPGTPWQCVVDQRPNWGRPGSFGGGPLLSTARFFILKAPQAPRRRTRPTRFFFFFFVSRRGTPIQPLSSRAGAPSPRFFGCAQAGASVAVPGSPLIRSCDPNAKPQPSDHCGRIVSFGRAGPPRGPGVRQAAAAADRSGLRRVMCLGWARTPGARPGTAVV